MRENKSAQAPRMQGMEAHICTRMQGTTYRKAYSTASTSPAQERSVFCHAARFPERRPPLGGGRVGV